MRAQLAEKAKIKLEMNVVFERRRVEELLDNS